MIAGATYAGRLGIHRRSSSYGCLQRFGALADFTVDPTDPSGAMDSIVAQLKQYAATVRSGITGLSLYGGKDAALAAIHTNDRLIEEGINQSLRAKVNSGEWTLAQFVDFSNGVIKDLNDIAKAYKGTTLDSVALGAAQNLKEEAKATFSVGKWVLGAAGVLGGLVLWSKLK